MIKFLSKNYLLLLENILLSFVGLFVNFYIANKLGPEKYGELFFIINLVFSLLLFSNISKPKITTLFIEKYGSENIISNTFFLNLITSFIAFLFLAIFSFFFTNNFIITTILSLVFFFNSLKFTKHLFISEGKGNFIVSISLIILSFFLLIRFFVIKFELNNIYFILTYLFEAISLNLFLFLNIKNIHNIKLSLFSKKYISLIAKSSFYDSLSAFISKVYIIELNYLIITYIGSASAAYYILTKRILGIMQESAIQFSLISFIFNIKNKQRNYLFDFIISFLLFLISFFVLEIIIKTFLSEEYNQVAFLIKYSSFLFIIFFFHNYLRDIYLKANKLKEITIISILTIIFSTIITLIYIKHHNLILIASYSYEIIFLILLYSKAKLSHLI